MDMLSWGGEQQPCSKSGEGRLTATLVYVHQAEPEDKCTGENLEELEI